VITIFDHRGCQRGGPNKEYTGPASNDQDDEMCVKVLNPIIPYKTNLAVAQVSLQMQLRPQPFTVKISRIALHVRYGRGSSVQAS
jgi:hypothetical protein